MPDTHKHKTNASRHGSSSTRPQQGGSRGGSGSQDAMLQGLAVEHQNLRRMDNVRHGAIFHMMPRAFRQRYNNELRRRGGRLTDQLNQLQDELAQEQALAQGPFAPDQVYRYIHHSPWTQVAENEQLTDVEWSRWTQAPGLQEEEEKQDPGHSDNSTRTKKKKKKNKQKNKQKKK